MQTYLVSILLRTITGRVGLLFYLTQIAVSISTSLWGAPDPIEKDSLLTQWAKTKSTLPTLFYELVDFNDFSDRVEAESLIRMYGIGGVVVPNGNIEEVKQWITQNRIWRNEPIIHIASINQVFELPFQNLPSFPNQLSVTCYTDDNLAYQLAIVHANLLKQTGIGMIEIVDVPDYYSSHELRKVEMYLQGLTDADMPFYFGKSASKNLIQNIARKELNGELINVLEIDQDGVLSKKSLKKYRSNSKDERLVFDYVANSTATLQQIERGVGVTIVSKKDKPVNFINHLLSESVPSKAYYKRHVKAYFEIYHRIEKNINTPFKTIEVWSELRSSLELKDIVLTRDAKQLLPFNDLGAIEFVTISSDLAFGRKVDKYKTARHLSPSLFELPFDSMLGVMPKEAIILVDLLSWDENDLNEVIAKCDSLYKQIPVVLFLEGRIEELRKVNMDVPVFWNPNDSKKRMEVMVEMAFGGRGVSGALPGYLQEDQSRIGVATEANNRLIYADGFGSIVNQQVLNKIDVLIANAIEEEMMPGCQIMMVKDGQVVYDKSFGHLTYDSLQPVQWNHVYDIASVTKTVATVPALMQRMDNGTVKLDGYLGDYLTDIDTTKAELTVDDILTHQSGLKSYIPFWRNAKYFSDSASFLYKKRKWRRKYSYHAINWSDSIQSWIAHSSYNSLSNGDGTYRYLYSDLGFMLMKDLVEENCQCAFDQSMDRLLYQPMGMNYTSFNPLDKIPKEQIAPTEEDKYFRSELLQGIVHDKNAALLGGVSGHAGLFSNANDLAKYMQMLLQGGYYGGVRYFSDSVVQVFTSKKNEQDRRAMGWDKPYASVGNASKYASEESFGHSGFTGTLVWADPKYDMVYIFLSNRIYPDPQNYKLIESNTRTKIHDLMYESFLSNKSESSPGS